MTSFQERIIERYGRPAIEVFNIARSHDRNDPPCVCMVCCAVYDKLSQYLADRDRKLGHLTS